MEKTAKIFSSHRLSELGIELWAERVFSFLIGKGLLYADDITPDPTLKISVNDAIKVGLEVEPRVIAVLPAAIIKFPENFTDLDAIPEKLADVVNRIKKGDEEGPSLAGNTYKDMKRWAVNVNSE